MPPEVISRSPSTASTLSCITVVQESGNPSSEGPASTPPTSVTDVASVDSASGAKDGMAAKSNGRVRRVTNVTSYNENVLSANTRPSQTTARSQSQSPNKGKSLLGKRTRDSSGGGARRSSNKKRRVSRRLIEVEKQKERALTDSPKKQTRQVVAEASKLVEPEIKLAPKKPRATARSKKFLAQGLYVGQDPDHDPRLTEEKNKKKLAASGKVLAKRRSLLPDPMLAGKRLLELGRGFRLPFNIFSPLPPGQPRPDEWRKTQKNVFVGDAADFWRFTKKMEHSTCLCEQENGCDEDCLNRYMFYECDSNNCNVGAAHCTNRAFDHLRHRVKAGGKFNVGVDVIKTADRGYGVRSNRCFEPNQIIMEYTGEIITQDECDDRMRNRYKENECFYLMMFDQNMIIDATRGSIARFVNHSCEPNCRMEKWTVAGKPRMALFAGDDGIVTGEELTYDYNFDPFSSKNIQECRCGSAHCRGVLGPRSKEKEGKPAADVSAAGAATAKGKAGKGGAGTKRKRSGEKDASSTKKRKLAVTPLKSPKKAKTTTTTKTTKTTAVVVVKTKTKTVAKGPRQRAALTKNTSIKTKPVTHAKAKAKAASAVAKAAKAVPTGTVKVKPTSSVKVKSKPKTAAAAAAKASSTLGLLDTAATNNALGKALKTVSGSPSDSEGSTVAIQVVQSTAKPLTPQKLLAKSMTKSTVKPLAKPLSSSSSSKSLTKAATSKPLAKKSEASSKVPLKPKKQTTLSFARQGSATSAASSTIVLGPKPAVVQA